MRNISPLALSTILKKKGGEPLILLEIFWNGFQSTFYCDRQFQPLNVQGKIIDLGDVEDVVNISGSSNSSSVSVKLDDTDGSIKAIYDTCDIHKRKVKVYQWFSELPLSDAFILFVGQINTPIVWSAAERTIEFEIVSKIEDAEVGFSPEEGQFSNIPADLIGKAWPLCFGTSPQVSPLQIEPIPTGTVTDSIGLVDEGLDQQMYDLIFVQAAELHKQNADMYREEWEKYLEDLHQHDEQYGTFGIFHDHEDFPSDPYGLEYVNARLDNLHEMGIRSQAIWAQITDLYQQHSELEQQKEDQEARYRSSLGVHNGNLFPQGIPMSIKLSGVTFNGSMVGDRFNINNYIRAEADGDKGDSIDVVVDPNAAKTAPGWLWIPAGQTIQILTSMPVRYLVSMLPVTILSVNAYQVRGQAKILTPVPTNYYAISYVNYGTITATIITLVKPLSYYEDEGWDDELFIDLVSPIGSNTCDQLAWLIQTYAPNLSIDATTFYETRAAVNPFQSNFTLFDRKNLLTVLQEISYQARCAIWLKNEVFYFRYLPNEPSPVETISESDIVYGSLEIHHTDTESLLTKLTAEYKVSYTQQSPNKIILRNNIGKYGLHEQTTDWYIYCNPEPVDLAATFWIIRNSNTWKLVQFKTPLHKLRIESFDAVTINFTNNYACYGPVTGIVQNVQIDTDARTMSFTVWLPVRLGEMTKYNFAWPVDNELIIYAPVEDTFAPGKDAIGDLAPINHASPKQVPIKGKTTVKKEKERTRPSDGNPNPGSQEVDNSITIVPQVNTDPSRRPIFDSRGRRIVVPRVVPPVPLVQGENRTLPGVVIAVVGTGYRVNVYPYGRTKDPVPTTVAPFDPTEPFKVGDVVNVFYVTSRKRDPRNPNRVIVTSFKYLLGGGKPGVYRGEVLSGSGGTYQVKILVGEEEKVVSCDQLQIDGDETIPAGVMALVGEYSTTAGVKKYFMQVPVWME